MKKIFFACLLFFLPALSHASITDEGVTREKTYVVHFTTTVASDTTGIVDLISLSTTSSLFPHTLINPADIGEIDVSHINIVIDKVAAATTTVKIGVATLVSASTGTINYFFTRSSVKNVSNTDAVAFDNFTPSFYRCRVRPANTSTNSFIDGTTPYILSNDKDSGLTALSTTTFLQSPISAGAVFPKTGDILMNIRTGATNGINLIVDVWYHAEP